MSPLFQTVHSDCAQAAVLPEEMQSEASLHLEGALVRYFASADKVRYEEPRVGGCFVATAACSVATGLNSKEQFCKASLFYFLVARCKLPLLESQVIIIMVANLLSCLAMITMVSKRLCFSVSLSESLFTQVEEWSNVLCSRVSLLDICE